MLEKDARLRKVLILVTVILGFCLIVAAFDTEPLTLQPLDELNPKARYVIINDDAGNHVKLDKTYIKTIHTEGNYIYIDYGNRNVSVVVYSDIVRRREMCSKILDWWKAS